MAPLKRTGADKYVSFRQLAEHEQEGVAFRVRSISRGPVGIIAIHGGGIDEGTSEIAEEIAADDYSFYAFEGRLPDGNWDLHLTATNFDEPRGLALATESMLIVSIHGEGKEGAPLVFLGGRNEELLNSIETSLQAAEFKCKRGGLGIAGEHPDNICNRTISGSGVQLELTQALRETFFAQLHSRLGRTKRSQRFYEFVAAVRSAIKSYEL